MSAEKEKVDTKNLIGTTLSQTVEKMFSSLKLVDQPLPLQSPTLLGIGVVLLHTEVSFYYKIG